MGSLAGSVLDEDQELFFKEVFTGSNKLEDVPKLIFVFKRTANVGLLFEGEEFSAGDFLGAEELENGEIEIHENVGELERAYTQELDTIFTQEFPELKQGDFILHHGVNTVLFACPSLGMYTHGYEEKTVEAVVRLYIDRIFEFIDNDGECSNEEREFFNLHKDSWEAKRSKFMEFTLV